MDLWGGMYGADGLVDADDPPVFIVHGTADATVLIQQSYDLTNRCGTIGLAYEFYPVQDAGHGCWGAFWNNVVNGKTIDRRCAEFLFEHLDLLPLHPVAATRVSCSRISGSDAVRLQCGSASDFTYQVESSTDLKAWSTNGMPAGVPGSGSLLNFEIGISGQPRQFFRMKVKPGF